MNWLRWLFRCRHRNLGFPFTLERGITYCVCMNCKVRVPYDWQEMRRVG